MCASLLLHDSLSEISIGALGLPRVCQALCASAGVPTRMCWSAGVNIGLCIDYIGVYRLVYIGVYRVIYIGVYRLVYTGIYAVRRCI